VSAGKLGWSAVGGGEGCGGGEECQWGEVEGVRAWGDYYRAAGKAKQHKRRNNKGHLWSMIFMDRPHARASLSFGLGGLLTRESWKIGARSGEVFDGSG